MIRKIFIYATLTALVVASILVYSVSSTQYAPSYSFHNFTKVTKGMSIVEVERLLGFPFRTSTQMWSEVWYFSTNNIFGNDETIQYKDSNWEIQINASSYTALSFDDEGIVKKFHGDFLGKNLVGLTKSDVTNLFMLPQKVINVEYVVVFHYSKSPASGNYWLRQVHFDKSNRVKDVISSYYFD